MSTCDGLWWKLLLFIFKLGVTELSIVTEALHMNMTKTEGFYKITKLMEVRFLIVSENHNLFSSPKVTVNLSPVVNITIFQ